MLHNHPPKEFVFKERWLADGIGERYMQWHAKLRGYPPTAPSHILIDSATGTGKTSFILEHLLPYAAEKGRHILYLGNRIALEEQIAKKLKETLEDITDYFECRTKVKVFRFPEKYGTIMLLNYQSVINTLKNIGLPYEPYYVIIDEAHFFLADAIFNRKTHDIWMMLLERFQLAVLVFMTATPEEFQELFYSNVTYLGVNHPNLDIYLPLYNPNIEIYKNEYRNSSYKFMCYYKLDEVVLKIKQSPVEEKWLIFVNSKKEGKMLYEKITEECKRKVKFISADSKKTKAWKLLVDESRFKEDILIVTKVIDNGVNITDSQVKHFVLPFCDRIEFLQMLGRKRAVTEKEEINVYIEQPSVQKVNSLLLYLHKRLNAAKEFKFIEQKPKEQRKKELDLLLKKFWNRKDNDVIQLFKLYRNNELSINELALYRMKLLDDFYSDLQRHYKNPNYYLNCVLGWTKNDLSSPVSHIYCEECYSLSDFIIKFMDVSILTNEWENFYYGFLYYYKMECYARWNTDSEKLEKAMSIRKGKTQRKATINKSLAMLELPYEIKKEKGCWVLRKMK